LPYRFLFDIRIASSSVGTARIVNTGANISSTYTMDL
jgi:hypothetical protein